MEKSFWRRVFDNQILIAAFFLGVALFLFEIRGLLVLLFTAFIIMAALLPAVKFLRRYRFPGSIAVFLPFSLSLLVIILLIMPLVPFFITQFEAFFASFPKYINQVSNLFHVNIDTLQINKSFTSDVNALSRNALGVTQRVFSGVFSLLTLLVISFYLLLDHERLKESITKLFPQHKKEQISETISKLEEKLGAWLRGQLLLSVLIGSTTWVALTLLGIDFALPLALLAGILEIVPTIGPIISSIPAIIIALTIDPSRALLVAMVYVVIQGLENNLFVPKIMEKAVGLNPIVVITSVIIGGKLLGVLGSLLAVPFVSCLIIVFAAVRENTRPTAK